MIRSYLARYVQSDATPAELERLRIEAWRKQAIIVIRPDEIRDDWLRQGIVNWARKRFGSRMARG